MKQLLVVGLLPVLIALFGTSHALAPPEPEPADEMAPEAGADDAFALLRERQWMDLSQHLCAVRLRDRKLVVPPARRRRVDLYQRRLRRSQAA